MKNHSLFAFVAGAAVGAVLGLLLAPEKGEESRRKVKDAAKGGRNFVNDALDSLEKALAEKVAEPESVNDEEDEAESGRKIEIE